MGDAKPKTSVKFLGYALAIAAGWFIWQMVLAYGYQVQRDHGPYLLQIILIWFCLPVGMGVAALIAWIWFKIFPNVSGRAPSQDAQSAGVLACLAAVASCGLFALSTQNDPPEALFFPLINPFSDR